MEFYRVVIVRIIATFKFPSFLRIRIIVSDLSRDNPTHVSFIPNTLESFSFFFFFHKGNKTINDIFDI